MATNNTRPSKADRLAAAREKAQAARAEAERAKKRAGLIRWGIVGLVVLIAAAVIVYFLVQGKGDDYTNADKGPVPTHATAQGGFVLTSPTEMAASPAGTASEVEVGKYKGVEVKKGEPATPGGVVKDANPAQIIIYADAACPHCAQFEATHAEEVDQLLSEKKATIEYRMVQFLPSPTNYPARAANALACVADAQPSAYLPMVTEIFASQADGELRNKALGELAVSKGAPESVKSCIDSGTYRPFVASTDGEARMDNIPGTPAVFVNGVEYNEQAQPNLKTFVEETVAAAKK